MVKSARARMVGVNVDNLVDHALMVYYKLKRDTKSRMPAEAPEDPEEEEKMKKFLEEQGMGDDYDYSKLNASKKMNDDDSIVYGSTETYDWSQSKTEMEVFVPNLPSSLRAKDISVSIITREIAVSLEGEEKLKGRLYAEVIPDECSWQVEDETNSDGRKLWISLYKKVPTLQNKMWPCVIEGDYSKSSASNVKIAPGGTPVTSIDLSDEDSMKEAIRQAKDAARARQKSAGA